MIPHNRPTLEQEEEAAALRVLRSGWVAQGQEVENFENELCKYLGLPEGHAVAVSSGTSAIYLALWSLNSKDKNVAFPPYVCSAVRNAVAMAGGKEKLIDIARNSPNIDLNVVQSSSANIAIVPHIFGIPQDVSKLAGIDVIEDCAQSLGARVGDKFAGLQGRVGIFSFYASKLITSGGQGGMVVSREREIVDSIRDYREFDCRKDSKARFNFQMTDLQAAVGREQLKKLNKFLNRRTEIFNKYKDSGLDMFLGTQESQVLPVRYRAILKTQKSMKIIESLAQKNIKSIVPIYDWELLGDKERFPNAFKLTQETVSLPLYPTLTDREVGEIISVVKEQ